MRRLKCFNPDFVCNQALVYDSTDFISVRKHVNIYATDIHVDSFAFNNVKFDVDSMLLLTHMIMTSQHYHGTRITLHSVEITFCHIDLLPEISSCIIVHK